MGPANLSVQDFLEDEREKHGTRAEPRQRGDPALGGQGTGGGAGVTQRRHGPCTAGRVSHALCIPWGSALQPGSEHGAVEGTAGWRSGGRKPNCSYAEPAENETSPQRGAIALLPISSPCLGLSKPSRALAMAFAFPAVLIFPPREVSWFPRDGDYLPVACEACPCLWFQNHVPGQQRMRMRMRRRRRHSGINCLCTTNTSSLPTRRHVWV